MPQTASKQNGAGQSITDSFTAVSSDGSASQLFTVTIYGTHHDLHSFPTRRSSDLEDVGVVAGNISTSGALTITDVDQGQANFTAQPSTAGSNGYGAFTLGAAHDWTSSTHDSHMPIPQLSNSQSITDSFTAVSSDGSASQLVTVTINGTNDVAVIVCFSSGALRDLLSFPTRRSSALGALTITDVDQGQANFTAQPSTAGSNGYVAF